MKPLYFALSAMLCASSAHALKIWPEIVSFPAAGPSLVEKVGGGNRVTKETWPQTGAKQYCSEILQIPTSYTLRTSEGETHRDIANLFESAGVDPTLVERTRKGWRKQYGSWEFSGGEEVRIGYLGTCSVNRLVPPN